MELLKTQYSSIAQTSETARAYIPSGEVRERALTRLYLYIRMIFDI